MKIIQFRQIIREIIEEELNLESQASDDAKRQGLEYMGFGRWGKDNKITHTTQSGKLVPVKGADGKIDRKLAFPPRVHKSPEDQRQKNKPQDALVPHHIPGDEGGEWQQDFTDMKKGRSRTTPAHHRVMDKVEDKLSDLSINGTLEPYQGKTMPVDQFAKLTGIPRKALLYYDQHASPYDPDTAFTYDPNDDTIQLTDPEWEYGYAFGDPDKIRDIDLLEKRNKN